MLYSNKNFVSLNNNNNNNNKNNNSSLNNNDSNRNSCERSSRILIGIAGIKTRAANDEAWVQMEEKA